MRFRELRTSVEARYAGEIRNAGVFRRMWLANRIEREFLREMYRPVEDEGPEMSKAETLFNLMCAVGILVVVCGVPGMAIECPLISYREHLDFREGIILVGTMMGLTGSVGTLLWWVGLHFARKCRRVGRSV